MIQTQGLSRRGFLRGSGAAAAATFVGTMQMLQARQALAAGGAALVASPYGPIAPVADLATGLSLLQLPAGFNYRSYSWRGDLMRNGQPTPGGHDGMALVWGAPAGQPVEAWLVRNHELGLGALIDAPAKYDTATITFGSNTGTLGGGTTNLVFRGRRWISTEPSLGGTIVNCAGGPTPWGSWLTCEETGLDLTSLGGKKHGYVFEVTCDPSHTTGNPLVDMGRFSHEAVAVDPHTNYAYLTEDDRNKAGFYRFVPNDASGTVGCYEQGGRLQMARAVGLWNADLIVAQPGDEYRIEWVDVPNPDADRGAFVNPDTGATNASGPFLQGWAQGGLRMSRGEGIWYSRGKLYVVDTSTGVDSSGRRGRGDGAVWEYDPVAETLRAIFVSTNPIAANNPDNITVSPSGGILLCEDGGGVADEFGFGDRLVGLTRSGDSFVFAKNNIVLSGEQIVAAGKTVAPDDYRDNEFCGACFDPTGRVLFVNIQTPGITFAIWGPWARGTL
jgi:hypothetical protein